MPPTNRKPIPALLNHWRAEPTIGSNFVAWEIFPARNAHYVPFPTNLHPTLSASLKRNGITKLYAHQLEAWNFAKNGENFAVVTGTASGKTLCYNLPILDGLLRNPEGRALYLFPTKALAQDQLAGIDELLIGSQGINQSAIRAATYDGDTSASSRPKIRQNANLIISNPDMLHTGILPHHTRWADFFSNLKFVVIDEMHTYRGVFGSHVANTLRRLKRIARFYGSVPQFALTSATIGNPAELAAGLIEEPVEIITQDGSERGPKHFVIYNPPVIDPDLGLRASMVGESTRLAEDLLTYDIQTIIFGRTRRTVEIMLRYLDPLTQATPDIFNDPQTGNTRLRKVRAYRSGYLPRKRREIEAELREGQIRMVIATTALELGIDIGGLDAALLAGYPGSIAGTWQQVGRAGRGDQPSLGIFVASANPLDQFLAQHPDYFFARSPENALINPDNLLILLNHLQCAVFELPFQKGELFGKVDPGIISELLEYLQEAGALHKSGQKFFWMSEEYPAAGISLRSASPNRILLQSNENGQIRTIGEVDWESAPWMTHPEAIYLHEGETYQVDDLDLEGKTAVLRPVLVDYYTRPQRDTEIQLLEMKAAEAVPGGTKAHGEIQVITQVTGYQKVRWGSNESLGFGKVDLPPSKLQTQGYWLALGEEMVAQLREEGTWNSDPNRYGPNWQTQRDKARQRDQFTCQVCGSLEQGRSHHVHHKTPFRAFGSPTEANRLENLVTLCPRCHLRVENAVRVRSGLGGLGYTLENLAPLFLMCDSGDLGVHVDPQSPLTEGKPTIVIYEMIPAGIGFSQKLFEIHAELLELAYQLVLSCDCTDGCPSCVGPGGELGTGSKEETLEILKQLTKK